MKVAQFKEKAEECRRNAERRRDPVGKAGLEMAEDWEGLAKDAERAKRQREP